ncbi:hypothetical protein AX15_006735 [Amanita polypyramis BW_CC]|nr:hypothetical protein AX15_006735 [Amanita polypyramis BW_CC]
MRTQLFLLVQLALVGFVAAQAGDFTISSVYTNTFIVNANQADGSPVQTGSDSPLTLTVDPSPDSASHTISTIYDAQSGYYIGIDSATSGNSITWVNNEFPWQIAKTSSGYVVYPAGPDLFWAQNSTIAPYIQIIPGFDIRSNEGFWNFNTS